LRPHVERRSPRLALDWRRLVRPGNRETRLSAKKKGFAFLLLLFFLTLASADVVRALDPRKQIGQYGHDSWTSQNGLPGEAVYQVLQSKDGYLWVRTGSGLSRFDGARFVSMDAEIGLEPTRAICMSAAGDLLIRTYTMTKIYKDGRFSAYRPTVPIRGGDIHSCFENRKHEDFVGEDNFIYRIEKNGDPTMLQDRTGWITTFLEDHTGTTWIAGSPALFSYRDGKLSGPYDSTAFGTRISALEEDHLHQLWAGTAKGLFRLDESGSKLTPVHEAGIPDLVTAVLEDHQGNLWVGTESAGLIRLTDKKISSINYVTGLTDENVLSLFEDREGSIWIGTANGLDRLRDTSLTTFTTREGLPSNRVNSALVTRDGTLHVFTDNGGLASINNDVVTPFDQNAKLPSLSSYALFESRDGGLWVGTANGLSEIKDGKLTVYDGGGVLAHNFISAISEDDESLLVANSSFHILRFKDGKVSPFTIRGRPAAFDAIRTYTSTIYRDPSGTLWFGTAVGLYKQPPADGHDAGWQLNVHSVVSSIFDDHQGNLWLGSNTPGLIQFRIRDGRVTHYAKREGLFDGLVSRVLADDDGNLWISTDDGIYSVSQIALEDLAAGKIRSVASRRFGLADGMKTTAASDLNAEPGGWRTPDGRLWFTTMKGIVVVDPRHLLHNNLVPQVHIESVSADGVEQRLGGELEFSPGLKAIEIHYTALSLRVPDRVRFKYQLEGYDRDWVDPGSRRVAYYTNLPPAHYRFRVIAANDDGLWNYQGDSMEFVLKPFFYQTRWFLVGCGLFAILIVFGANRYYTRLIRARADQLSILVNQRTAELSESHRELERLARLDVLTALPNRRKFDEDFREMFSKTKDEEDTFSLLLIDFDRFKKINDTFGHDAGDAFLIEAAKRLALVLRTSDSVARLGGDEFAILLGGDHDESGIGKVCERILHSFSTGIDFRGVTIRSSVSVGAAVFPHHGLTQEELYKSADLALYEAKRLGRNNWRWYHPALQNNGSKESDPLAPGWTASVR
jgi:diguanylate cyclase (GGDEF)-like protein